MGAYLSSAELPALPPDVIQLIIERTPTTTIVENVFKVNKTWLKIGKRNVIWIPRYKLLTGIDLNPYDFKEGEVYDIFIKEWLNYVHIWDIMGFFYKTRAWNENLKRIPVTLIINGEEVGTGGILRIGTDIYIEKNGKVRPVPGNYWTSYPESILVVDNQAYKVVRESGYPLQAIPMKVLYHEGNDLLGCDMCGQSNLSSFCRDCGKVYCETCIRPPE